MTTATASGPLAGVKIIEFAGIGPGPFAGMVLADLGADVIGIDRPGGAGPFDLPVLRRGRRSIAVDLKSEAGRAVILDLVASADALIEPYRPGVMERLGLGPDACLARNPRLVYARMTGWGQDGPQSPYAGHDLTYTATAGILSSVVRDPHDGSVPRPVLPGPYLGDVAGGALLLVTGLLAALHSAAATGAGQVVDAAITDGASYLTTFTHALRLKGMWGAAPGNNLLDTGAPFYEVYECADGRHLAIGALEPQFYNALLHLLAEHAGLDLGPDDPRRPEHRLDPARWPEAKALWESFFRTRTRDDWCAFLERSDACVAPVLSLEEAPAHPHLDARAAYMPVGGEHGPTLPVPAPRFSSTPTHTRPVPAQGEHTDELLGELGYHPARIATLRSTSVVA